MAFEEFCQHNYVQSWFDEPMSGERPNAAAKDPASKWGCCRLVERVKLLKTPERSDIQRAVDLGLIISGTEKAPVIVPLVLITCPLAHESVGT